MSRAAKPVGPGRGTRVIKPKKADLIKQTQLKKVRVILSEASTLSCTDPGSQKHCGGLSAMTEKLLAEKAGHLEMLKGGKKERNEKLKNKAMAQAKKN